MRKLSVQNKGTKRFKKQCWQVLFVWLLCTISTSLMASMPGVEQKDGYIAICTAQGVKWIPVSDFETAESTFSPEPYLKPVTQNPTNLDATVGQLSQHCTACVVSTANEHSSAIVVSLEDYLEILYPPATLIFLGKLPEYLEHHVVSQKLSRAPPSSAS